MHDTRLSIMQAAKRNEAILKVSLPPGASKLTWLSLRISFASARSGLGRLPVLLLHAMTALNLSQRACTHVSASALMLSANDIHQL